MTAERRFVHAKNAPAPKGPYSHALVANGFIFLSGQGPHDPATGVAVAGDVRAQSRRLLENVKTVLEAAGSSLDRVVKVTFFIVDFADYAAFNEVYAEYFPGDKPARSGVQGQRPGTERIGMDVIALA